MNSLTQLRLTTEQDWKAAYQNTSFEDLADHSVALFIQKHAKPKKGSHSIELGSYPGSFLPTLGRMGYTVHGVDFNPNNTTALPSWLRQQKIKTGEFFSTDVEVFCNTSTTNQYDLVCSYGLIEHFKNFEEVIMWHAKLVRSGGQLIITTPNLKGFLQLIPHLLFDRRNLRKHHLPSMNPAKWKELLQNNGFNVSYAGYFGGYAFWVDRNQKRNLLSRLLLRFTERSISQLNKLINRFALNSQLYSAFCGLVAVKK